MSKQEALEYLVGLGSSQPKVVPIHESRELITKLVCNPDGTSTVYEFQRDPEDRNHEFSSLADLAAYLNSDYCQNDDGGIVFVETARIIAALEYRKRGIQQAILKMDLSPEYTALMGLFKGINQQALWKSLISDLDGCITGKNGDPEELLGIISAIQFSEQSGIECEIMPSGTGSASASRSIALAIPQRKGDEKKQTDIPVNWKYKGRIWSCFPAEAEIVLRLEISKKKDEPPVFIFHPKRLDQVSEEMRGKLVEELNDKLEIAGRFRVFQGTMKL